MATRPRVVVPVALAAVIAAVLGGLAGSAWFADEAVPVDVVTALPTPAEVRAAPPAPAAPVLSAPALAEPAAEPGTEAPATAAELVPAIEDRVVALANEARAAAGVAPLERMGELDAVARGWSTTLATRAGDLAHNPDYSSQIPQGWSMSGENVGWIGEKRVVPAEEVARAVHQGWMDSAGHRENLLNPEFTHLGVGVAFTAERGYYLTQNFASY